MVHRSDLASYQEFDQKKFDAVLASHQPTMLYFYANWCGTCAVQEPKYEEVMKSYAHPIQAFRVDFDQSKELRMKYRVFLQSTAVFIGADGQVLGRLVGEQEKSDIISAFDAMRASVHSPS